MNKRVVILAFGMLAILLVGFETRVESYHIPDFSIGLAAGWLDSDSTREYAMKSGHVDDVYGHNEDSDAEEESVYEGHSFVGPIRCFTSIGTSAVPFYISSDHEDDAGLGVHIEALDANWDRLTIEATLGAASASGTVFAQVGSVSLLRVNEAHASGAGLTGNVYIHKDDVDGGTDGVPDTILTDLVTVIDAGENQVLQACYTVPNNFIGLMSHLCVDNVDVAANADAVFKLRESTNGGASRVRYRIHLNEGQRECQNHTEMLMFPEKTDIEITNTSSANNAVVGASFDLMLLPDS